jgi:hypothetical protein
MGGEPPAWPAADGFDAVGGVVMWGRRSVLLRCGIAGRGVLL